VTVFELLEGFEKVLGRPIKSDIAPPRDGDVAGACANPAKAARLLGWQAKSDIRQGIADALEWVRLRDSIVGTANA